MQFHLKSVLDASKDIQVKQLSDLVMRHGGSYTPDEETPVAFVFIDCFPGNEPLYGSVERLYLEDGILKIDGTDQDIDTVTIPADHLPVETLSSLIESVPFVFKKGDAVHWSDPAIGDYAPEERAEVLGRIYTVEDDTSQEHLFLTTGGAPGDPVYGELEAPAAELTPAYGDSLEARLSVLRDILNTPSSHDTPTATTPDEGSPKAEPGLQEGRKAFEALLAGQSIPSALSVLGELERVTKERVLKEIDGVLVSLQDGKLITALNFARLYPGNELPILRVDGADRRPLYLESATIGWYQGECYVIVDVKSGEEAASYNIQNLDAESCLVASYKITDVLAGIGKGWYKVNAAGEVVPKESTL